MTSIVTPDRSSPPAAITYTDPSSKKLVYYYGLVFLGYASFLAEAGYIAFNRYMNVKGANISRKYNPLFNILPKEELDALISTITVMAYIPNVLAIFPESDARDLLNLELVDERGTKVLKQKIIAETPRTDQDQPQPSTASWDRLVVTAFIAFITTSGFLIGAAANGLDTYDDEKKAGGLGLAISTELFITTVGFAYYMLLSLLDVIKNKEVLIGLLKRLATQPKQLTFALMNIVLTSLFQGPTFAYVAGLEMKTIFGVEDKKAVTFAETLGLTAGVVTFTLLTRAVAFIRMYQHVPTFREGTHKETEVERDGKTVKIGNVERFTDEDRNQKRAELLRQKGTFGMAWVVSGDVILAGVRSAVSGYVVYQLCDLLGAGTFGSIPAIIVGGAVAYNTFDRRFAHSLNKSILFEGGRGHDANGSQITYSKINYSSKESRVGWFSGVLTGVDQFQRGMNVALSYEDLSLLQSLPGGIKYWIGAAIAIEYMTSNYNYMRPKTEATIRSRLGMGKTSPNVIITDETYQALSSSEGDENSTDIENGRGSHSNCMTTLCSSIVSFFKWEDGESDSNHNMNASLLENETVTNKGRGSRIELPTTPKNS